MILTPSNMMLYATKNGTAFVPCRHVLIYLSLMGV